MILEERHQDIDFLFSNDQALVKIGALGKTEVRYQVHDGHVLAPIRVGRSLVGNDYPRQGRRRPINMSMAGGVLGGFGRHNSRMDAALPGPPILVYKR